MTTTREPQYASCLELRDRQGLAQLGLMTNETWHLDPKRLAFVLARYKFVAKMLSGLQRVLEVGCADAFGTRIVLQEVGQVTAVDFDAVFVRDVQQRMDPRWPLECHVHDILEGPVAGPFDGAYALDLLEHIPPDREDVFLTNLSESLTSHGVLVLGTPSLQSQAYASPASRAGHVNCKDAVGLRTLTGRFFHNVFIFSMNDEVVHTGFYPMAHYLFAVCCGRKPPQPQG
jgi:2-polyprenyl-3-methyl-5-hydroxy-6-metoxy-1,4-benzoquinol methylase